MTDKFDLKSFFEQISIQEPIKFFKNIVLIPLKNLDNPSFEYISLNRAIDENLAEVKEIDTQGSVPEILVINKSNHYIFIPQGEQLVGAKQNRIVNISILLEPNSKTKIPVSCIEQGRWHYIRQDFLTSEEYIPYKLRKSSNKSVVNNLMKGENFKSNQFEIWDFIFSDFKKDNLYSQTFSYTDYIKSKVKQEKIENSTFNLPEGINGFAFYVGAKLVSIEYFSNPDFFRENFDRIMKAIIVDAQDYPNFRFKKDFNYQFDLHQKVENLFTLNHIAKKSVGAGFNFSALNTNLNLELSFLVYDNQIIHLVSFF